MTTCSIPHTDLVVSRLAFGCAMAGWDWNDPQFVTKAVPLIHMAYDHGITFFDTADIYGYGKSEEALGKVLKRSPGLRQKIVIQTKCGERFKDGGVVDNSGEYILRSAEGSLQRLGADHIDVLLLHWPDSLVEPQEVAEAFDKLQRSGKVRYFGVSNHSPGQIEILKKYVRQPLVANQIQLGLAHWYVGTPDIGKSKFTHGAEGAVTVESCRAHDIQVQAYSPLRGSVNGAPLNLLTPAADASLEVKKAAQMLADIARKNDVAPAAVMLAWLLHHPARIVPIVGGAKAEHLIENFMADRVRLSREEWYALLDAVAAIDAV